MLDIGKFWMNTVRRPKEPEPGPEAGSTIPREVRMGVKSLLDVPAEGKPGTDTRSAPRFVPRKTTTSLTLASGKKVNARVVNMSAFAVAVEADLSNAEPDSVTMVGSQPVKFGRKITLGAVFLFVKPISASQCTVNFLI